MRIEGCSRRRELATDLLSLSAAAEKFMIYTVGFDVGNADKADLSD